MAENRGEIPMAELSQNLDIAENEIEDFLIDVIKTRLVRAKISQVHLKKNIGLLKFITHSFRVAKGNI